jgi:quinol monooxygenase YgiN
MPSGISYAVTYVEAAPAEAEAVAAALTQLAAAELLVLRETGRRSRFALVAGRPDGQAPDTSSGAPAALQNRLRPQLAAPFDCRPSSGLIVGPEGEKMPPGALYVLTHVDVPPASKDDCIALLRRLTEASRSEAGVLRFDVLQQDSRSNHFTVVEAWRDRAAHDSHVTAGHTRDFREKLTPISGALYDERVYETIR